MSEHEQEHKDSREETNEETPPQDVFELEEIQIEEMTIDGICGVY